MKKILVQIFSYLKIENFLGLLLNRHSYIKNQGWYKSSYQLQSIDASGKPIPWLTYPFIQFIEPRLNKSLTAYEFGCGNSTIWFAERIKTIRSVEHHKEWFDKTLSKIPANGTIVYKDFPIKKSYADISFLPLGNSNGYTNDIVESAANYDIIIIDGIDRNNCIEKSLAHLTDAGVIIVDNLNLADEMSSGLDLLERASFRRLEFWGMCPIVYNISCTAVFYKSNNCLGI